jgi:WhiB family redox-sensing transcriptional regulator
MTVLFSELLLPGWAEGESAMIGINDLADASAGLPCHNVDPEVFFAETKPEVAYAKALCGECPMKAKCLSGALSRKEPCGVWGGQLFEDGKVIKEKRAPGRPRILSIEVSEVEEVAVASRVA